MSVPSGGSTVYSVYIVFQCGDEVIKLLDAVNYSGSAKFTLLAGSRVLSCITTHKQQVVGFRSVGTRAIC